MAGNYTSPGVKYYGKDFHKKLDQGMIKNITAAGKIVYEEAKQLLSRPGRTVTRVTTKTGKTRVKYGKRGGVVSAPGEPPRKQTGVLFRSLKRKLFRKRMKVKILDLGRALEYGTDSGVLKPRPHLRVALANKRAAVAAALVQYIDTGRQ